MVTVLGCKNDLYGKVNLNSNFYQLFPMNLFMGIFSSAFKKK